MKTRSQKISQQVFEQINDLSFSVNEANEAKRSAKIKTLKKEYGTLCHNFPLMVLRSGLSQSVAFVWVKSKNGESLPQVEFLKHLSVITGESNETAKDFQERINGLSLNKYMRLTRKILAASIWYKRFAESLLGVKAGEETSEDQAEEEQPEVENNA